MHFYTHIIIRLRSTIATSEFEDILSHGLCMFMTSQFDESIFYNVYVVNFIPFWIYSWVFQRSQNLSKLSSNNMYTVMFVDQDQCSFQIPTLSFNLEYRRFHSFTRTFCLKNIQVNRMNWFKNYDLIIFRILFPFLAKQYFDYLVFIIWNPTLCLLR